MDINAAKNSASWDDILDHHVFSGYPPTCDDITAEQKSSLHSLSTFSYIRRNWMRMSNMF
eukprot:7646213-Ditylum_brightwellii.AAC.1